jgi:hypothetical protein
MGIAGAQASLLALWIGLGASRLSFRLITTVFGFAWLGLAMCFQPGFSGSELLLVIVPAAVATGAFSAIRTHTGRVLARPTDSDAGLPFQFHIRHLLLLTLIVALGMAVAHLTEDTGVEWIVYMFLMLACFASIPLAVCWAVFGRGKLKWRTSASTIIVLLVASAWSLTAYWQTQSRMVALYSFIWSVIEAAVFALSVWFLLRFGYRITTLRKSASC